MENTISKLKDDYKFYMEGYNYRDQLVPQEFANIVQVFSLFVGMLIALNIFGNNSNIYLIIQICLGLAGLLAMFSLHIDMQSNLSCKTALREESIKIEAKLKAESVKLDYWNTVHNRTKYKEEKLWKGAAGLIENSRKHGDIFIWASRALILIWLVVDICSIVY